MESLLGASRGTRVGCSLPRNKAMGSISTSRCQMGCINFAANDLSHMRIYARELKVSCGKTCKLEKNLKNSAVSHDGSLSDKRRIKLLKSVSKNLMLLSVSFSQDAEKSLLQDVRGQNFSDALQVLMIQLEAEKGEYKQRKKAMKADEKGMKAQKKLQKKCGDGSFSCDSTSTGCEGFVNHIPGTPLIRGDSIPAIIMEGTCSNMAELQKEYGEGEEGVVGTRRVEVCMGGKCKKMGADQLLSAFEEEIKICGMGCGVQAVSCKCVGKCRNGPNVKVQSDACEELHMGVEIADVGFVLDQYFGVKQHEHELRRKNTVCV